MENENNIKESSSSLGSLYDALAKAQAELKPAKKDKNNPFFKSTYADLSGVREAVLPIFNKHGLSFVQMPVGGEEGSIGLTTVLAHKDGGSISSTMYMKPVKDDPQGRGSCITYMCRYALAAFSGLPLEDDDANTASGKVQQYQPKTKSSFK